MSHKSLALILFNLLLLSCSPQKSGLSFTFEKSEQGITLFENGSPVFFYRSAPQSLAGQYVCSNYIHPLYSLDGDTLTEESPADHPYHRGIFWAWHQHYVGKKSIGDGWIMQGISYDVVDVQTKTEKTNAEIKLHVLWRSMAFRDAEPYMDEHTTIIVHPTDNNIRRIDFKITLLALVPQVSIGGSADKKGYGGFCCRIKMPDGLTFTSSSGKMIPQRLQIKAGPWMDFSAPFGEKGKSSGLTLLCHKDNPNYPQPWILRQKESMQNIVFPGEKRVLISTVNPTILRYRLLVHRRSGETLDMQKFQNEYNTSVY